MIIGNQKQETLEESAERFLKNGAKEFKTAKQVLIEFAKWQQERMYSEEEVRKIFDRYNEVIAHRDIEEWQPWIDKQFKKK